MHYSNREKAIDMARYAYENVIFYHNIYEKQSEIEHFEDLPIVTKEEMMKEKGKLLARHYYIDSSSLVSEYTSGTTGMCMEVSWNHYNMTQSLLPLWLYRKKYYGILPDDKFCYFYTYRNPGEETTFYERRKNQLGFSKSNLSLNRILEIFSLMEDFEPTWLLLQPSIAMLLAQTIFENGLEEISSLKYIELSGEMYTENQKNFIQAAFGCECRSQYGTHEVNSIAYECPCGNSGKMIELLGCRKNDVVACDDGSNVNAYEFIKIFQCINNYTDIEIQQYQIVQREYRKFDVHIVSKAEKKKLISYFLNNISSNYLKESEFSFHVTSFINPTKQGKKHRFFSCLVNKNFEGRKEK